MKNISKHTHRLIGFEFWINFNVMINNTVEVDIRKYCWSIISEPLILRNYEKH